jgi:hypothetical protein
MIATSTSITRETIAKIKWNHLEENWEQEEIPCIQIPSNLIKGKGKGKYKNVQQITFLTPETKQILLIYKNWYQRTYNHKWIPENNIFLKERSATHEPLTKDGLSRVITRITERAGIQYGIHEGRTRIQTALENVGTPENWIQKIKGRKVRGEQSPYSKPAIEQLRQKFKDALPDIEFLTTTNKNETEIKNRIQIKYEQKNKNLQDQINTLSMQLKLITKELNKNGIKPMQLFNKIPEEGKENITPPDDIALFQPKKQKTTDENIEEMLKLIPEGKNTAIEETEE